MFLYYIKTIKKKFFISAENYVNIKFLKTIKKFFY